MKCTLKSMLCPRRSSASVVDGKLILSFPDALVPVVWQMDLIKAKASALKVREEKDATGFTLTLTNPNSEEIDIASFDKRERAIDGLMAASKALENAHGQIKTATIAGNNTTGGYQIKSSSSSKWKLIILGIVILIVLFGIWGSLIPHTPESFVNQGVDSTAFMQTPQSNTSGVPMSADDFLKGY